jgi:AcrR family transcriptional regulator
MGRNPKITNDEILEAARDVFLDQGVGASTADIADRAGISEASIFKRFATKQDLFMAAIGITKTPTWVKKLESGTPTAEIKTELIEICAEMLTFYQDALPRILMMMSPMKLLQSRQFVPPPLRDGNLLAGFLERAIDLGYLRPCDARTVAQAIVGAINHYSMTKTVMKLPIVAASAKKHTPLQPEEFARSLIETFWAGIAPSE